MRYVAKVSRGGEHGTVEGATNRAIDKDSSTKR